MSARRLLKTSTIICIALGVLLFIYVYVNPVTLLSVTRWKARAKPELWMVPRPLPAASIEQTVGQTFTFYGYQFEVPWTEVKREEHLKSINQLKLLTREGTENEAVLKRILGEEVTRSNYMLRSKILNLTPSDLHLSLSRQKMVSSSVPLMLKPMWTGNLQGGLYSFQTEWLQGFQRGDPTRDKTVTIDAFDTHG